MKVIKICNLRFCEPIPLKNHRLGKMRNADTAKRIFLHLQDLAKLTEICQERFGWCAREAKRVKIPPLLIGTSASITVACARPKGNRARRAQPQHLANKPEAIFTPCRNTSSLYERTSSLGVWLDDFARYEGGRGGGNIPAANMEVSSFQLTGLNPHC